MTDLQNEIDEMTSQNSSLVTIARVLERNWLKLYLDGYGHYYFPIERLFQKFGLRIVRQCGDKQVGKNTLLTTLYQGSSVISTLKIFFDVENHKLKIEVSC